MRATSKPKPSVLIIDDENDIAELLVCILQDEFDADIAVDARAALSMIETNLYDLCITDIRMPNVEGVEILRAMKTFLPKSKTLVMSGYSERDPEVVGILAAGADGFLQKPFSSIQDVREKLWSVLQHSFFATDNAKHVG